MPRAVRGVVAAAVVAIAAVLWTATGASASTPALAEFGQARSQLQALIGPADSSGKAALSAAVTELGAATAASLWSDSGEPVPPPYGDAVFEGAEAALAALAKIHRDGSVSQSAVTAASDAIVKACTELTSAVRRQAGLPQEPEGGGSVQRDRADFDSAFRLLGVQITHEATGVSQSTVEHAASNYLTDEASELLAVPQPIAGPALAVKGRPEFFYLGAEGCPYCGVDRWSIVVALAQFGTFPPLALSVSSAIDPPTARTFSFYESRFTSPHVAFVPVERYTNQPNQPGEPPLCEGESAYPWSTLQTPTASEQDLISRYDGFEPCPGVAAVLPFLDIANTWSTLGSYPDPNVIAGMSWQQIAASLSNPDSIAGQAIDGGAEIVTAQICEVDGGHPTRVCGSSVVRHYQEEVKSGFR